MSAFPARAGGRPAKSRTTSAEISPATVMCAGYGRMWIVFRDGLVSCLRPRLDYVQSYGTDCHCAGNYATILKSE